MQQKPYLHEEVQDKGQWLFRLHTLVTSIASPNGLCSQVFITQAPFYVDVLLTYSTTLVISEIYNGQVKVIEIFVHRCFKSTNPWPGCSDFRKTGWTIKDIGSQSLTIYRNIYIQYPPRASLSIILYESLRTCLNDLITNSKPHLMIFPKDSQLIQLLMAW